MSPLLGGLQPLPRPGDTAGSGDRRHRRRPPQYQRQPMLPGWKATVDGEPAAIQRANVMFRAVEVPAGRHAVVFHYAPAWLWPAAAVSLLAAVALLLLTLGPRRQ